MFLERLISGIILVIMAFVSIYFGGCVLGAVTLLISLIGMFELFRVFEFQWKTAAWIGYISCVGYYVLIALNREQWIVPEIMCLILALMISFVLEYPKADINKIICVVFAFAYVAMMLSCLYRIRNMDGGLYLVWLVFIGAWGSDTCAYCVGRLIGKHKAFPVLSPKKSVEGCVGGVVGAALLAFLYALIFKDKLTVIGSPVIALPIIGACASVLSQFGDLAASAIKRQKEIKDYGKLIPGHGGILDRFDSVIFTAPVVYILLLVFAI